VHVVVTEPGMVRGNHVHRLGTEVLVVVGGAEVRLAEGDEVRDYEVPEGMVQRFVIPAGVAHAVRHTGSGPGLLVSFSTREHDPAAPDTYRVELF
jgi:UDP-2-acetamido-2,6-beta-L-arabino-hexul-4-ose reductase